MKMTFTVELKWYVAGICILCIVIYKFRYKEKPYLIILILIEKSSQIYLHYTFLSLYLTIYLWMDSCKQSMFYAKEVV